MSSGRELLANRRLHAGVAATARDGLPGACRRLRPAGDRHFHVGQPRPGPPPVLHRYPGWEDSFIMKNEYPPENPPDKIGNEPAPLLLMAVAVVPLLGVAGWLIFG